MSRHAAFTPRSVIPAVILPFTDDLAIGKETFRKRLSDAATEDLPA